MIEVEIVEYGNVIVLELNGVFYSDSSKYIEELFLKQIEKKPKVIAINCKHLTSIDSSALGLLIKLLQDTKRLNIDFVIYDLSERIKKIFKVTNLDHFFQVITKHQFKQKYLS